MGTGNDETKRTTKRSRLAVPGGRPPVEYAAYGELGRHGKERPLGKGQGRMHRAATFKEGPAMPPR